MCTIADLGTDRKSWCADELRFVIALNVSVEQVDLCEFRVRRFQGGCYPSYTVCHRDLKLGRGVFGVEFCEIFAQYHGV